MQNLLPEQRRSIGIMLIVFGLLCVISATFVIVQIGNARTESASRFAEAQNSCKSRLQALGGRVEEAPGQLIWLKDNIVEAPIRLGEASVAAVLCPGWQLRNSCVGSDCPEPNSMRIVLEPLYNPDE